MLRQPGSVPRGEAVHPHATRVRAIRSTLCLVRTLHSQLQFIILARLPLMKKKKITVPFFKASGYLYSPRLVSCSGVGGRSTTRAARWPVSWATAGSCWSAKPPLAGVNYFQPSPALFWSSKRIWRLEAGGCQQPPARPRCEHRTQAGSAAGRAGGSLLGQRSAAALQPRGTTGRAEPSRAGSSRVTADRSGCCYSKTIA